MTGDLVIPKTSAGFTPGSVLFGDSDGSASEDNTSFFWDNMIQTLRIDSRSDTQIMLKQTVSDAYTEISASSNVFDGVRDDLFGWSYNRDGAATEQPIWSEGFESRYASGAPPEGLLERHFNYTSIDRTVSYRPWNFHVNLNTHNANVMWNVLRYNISSRTEPGIYVFDTSALGGATFQRPLEISNDLPQLNLSTKDRQFRASFYTNSSDDFGELVIQSTAVTVPQGAFVDYTFMTLRAKALGVSTAGVTEPAGIYLQSGNNASGTNVGLQLNSNSDVLQIVDAGGTGDPTRWNFSRVKLATPFLGVGTIANLTERIVMPNSGFLGGVNAAGTSTIKLIGLNASDNIRMDFDMQSSVGPAGTASPLPSSPAGYIVIDIQGNEYVIPFYFSR